MKALAHFDSLYPENTRFFEIKEIIKFIKQGNSCQLISLPGAGRSSVFGLLAYNRSVRLKHFGENQKWFHFVNTNVSEIKFRPLFDLNKFLFLRLTDSLRERGLMEEHARLEQIFKDHLEYKDDLVLFQGLKEAIDYLAIEKELTVIFLFDRFEEYIPMLTNEFFANLRILRNRAKYRFSAVFSLSRPLEQIIDPLLFGQFFEFVADHIVYLSLLDKEGLYFRLSYLEKSTGKKISKELFDEIISLTAGHGKLTRISLETCLLSPREDDLETFLLNQKPVQSALSEIYSSLLPSEQVILKQAKKEDLYLENIGLLKDGKITIPLFEAFIKEIKDAFLTKISFEQETGQIKINELNISENLSALEFRLLKFLIENPGKILERDEVINAVWQTKATAGVSDQALDQLISRVRKKIETDPNSPIHLETIKGRGFKFNP
ncbi:helix-turn-helix domain-containing protein [Patescibacteria group bacterium]|nr:helix-turn-helix domain-containing protein [Patescibacteria group bacterium]